jgi:hypothetical protein
MGLRHVIDLMVAKIHATRSYFMKLWLPDVGSVFVHQGDTGLFASPVSLTKSSGKLKTASTSANNDNFVHVCLRYLMVSRQNA